MNDFGLFGQDSRFYEQLIVVDDMINLGSFELRPLDDMNLLGCWMISMIFHHEIKPIDFMNC